MLAVTFVSSNQNKYRELQSILEAHGISVDFVRMGPVEIQADSLEEIAAEKARSAFAISPRPVIIEDDGLFVDDLNGFPGPYSSHAFKTIGNEGIMKLLAQSIHRSASFRSIIGFYDGKRLSIFEGRVAGRISNKITEGGWGYDPIFVPDGTNLTFAQLKEKKNEYSHRKSAAEKFARWYSTAIV